MASKRRNLIAYLRDTALPYITVAHGYNFDVGTIKWGINEIDALPLSAFPVLNIANTLEDRVNITQNQFKGNPTVTILGFVKSASGTTGTQDEIEKLIEDVTKALERDRLQGGNAHATMIKRIVTTDGDADDIGVCAISVEFEYATEGATP